MKKHLLLSIICIVNCVVLQAQSFQLFTEDFENTIGFTLNSGGPSAAVGNNKWIVTNNYVGAPTYPNTMSEDSTYSGNITFAPHSKYLHIYDSNSGITNANYDPTNQSDNFTYLTNGLCTLGMDSVHFIFFYLCQGSSTSYGEVYYSINNGPWVQTGQSQYNNKYKWQYEDITDPLFSNRTNIRFGFRWVNESGAASPNESFSIDDVDIVASYGSNTGNPVTCTVDSIVPNPVCQGNFIFIYWHLSDTLCDGSYTIQLSTATGTFPGSNAWIFNIYYPQTSGLIPIQLPNTVPVGTCYKIRINRTSPLPAITGIASGCFTIQVCPNTITTLQPVITYDTNAVCIGSAIDIPFWSTGVYTFNTYTAQLSDSAGNFPLNPTVINTSFNSATYDPNLPPYQPGTISGVVPTVTPSCNYYVRVVSNSGVAIGTPWGPFCIRQCDMETNHRTDLHFCVTDCAIAPLGQNTTIPIETNFFDSTATGAIYFPGNIFETQLMSSMNFGHIGSDGIYGSVAGTHDTTMRIHVPCKDSLGISPPYGIPLGMNYMRVIATNTSQPDNALGTLIRVTVGATHAVGPSIEALDYTTFTAKDTFCVGDQIYPQFAPYNYFDNSTYTWVIGGTGGGFNGGNPFQNAQGANSDNTGYVFNFIPGTYTLRVQETNNGCVGPYGPTKTIYVLGPPNVSITGPSIICQGDSVHYSIPGQGVVTHGVWTSNNAQDTLINPTNTETDVMGNGLGVFHLTIDATNSCGHSTSTKIIQVKPYPTVAASNDTSVCINQPVTLTTPTANGYTFSWANGTNIVSSTQTATVTPSATTTYTVTVTSTGGCKRKDSVKVNVETPTSLVFLDSVCPQGASPIILSADSTGSYLWSTGETSRQITVNDTGVYSVIINLPNRTCARTLTFDVKVDPCPTPMVLPNVFTPGGDGQNDFFTPITVGRFDKFHIKIYDRWGLLMFESTDEAFHWDGRNKSGKNCPDGVYYYVIETTTAKVDNSFTGFITLIR